MSNQANQPESQSPARDAFLAAAAAKMEDGKQPLVERSLWQGGYSPKAMYGTWATSAIVTVAAIALIAVFAANIPNIWPIAGAVLIFWWVAALATFLYRRLSVHYELTTQRFVHQAGILVRRTDRIEVIDIDDVSYTQGIIQRMLGVGTIRLTGSDRTHPEMVLSGIDRVPEVASMFDDVRRAERRRRSLHIESV
jgi:membrane protein YdbS with pleckstrin-like domain